MRWLVLLATLSGCAFDVRGVDTGPGTPATPAPDNSTSSVPPSTGSVTTDPPATTPMPDAGPALAVQSGVGNPCDNKKKSCTTGQLCQTKTVFGQDIPGGYCSLDCNGTACPGDAQCSTQWGSFRVCLQTCPAAGCRPGYVCCTKSYAAPGVCLPTFLCT